MIEQLNRGARERVDSMAHRQQWLRIYVQPNGVIDFGVNVRGGLEAGLELARICAGDLASISLIPGDGVMPPRVQFLTDQPGLACMGCQYGGWPVKSGDYFAIGSGPIRLIRGKEKVLDQYDWSGSQEQEGVLVLESGTLPDESVIQYLAEESGLDNDQILVCVAPTGSMAGSLQVVARVVEATMHKLYELDVNLNRITSGLGTAPLPPVSRDDLTAIGRTNDAILYGGNVTLWVELSDEEIQDIGPSVPSTSSSEYGKSFEELFKACGGDFYKMDPMLFSAARVKFISNTTGNSFVFGETREEMIFSAWMDQ